MSNPEPGEVPLAGDPLDDYDETGSSEYYGADETVDDGLDDDAEIEIEIENDLDEDALAAFETDDIGMVGDEDDADPDDVDDRP